MLIPNPRSLDQPVELPDNTINNRRDFCGAEAKVCQSDRSYRIRILHDAQGEFERIMETIPHLKVKPMGEDEIAALARISAFCSNNAEGSALPWNQGMRVMRTESVAEYENQEELRTDAHEMLATYQELVKIYATVPNPELPKMHDWSDRVRARHCHIFDHGGKGATPGEYKKIPNETTPYTYTLPENVSVGMIVSHSMAKLLAPGLAQALMLDFGIVEVHPFDDGNGRSARLEAACALHGAGSAPLLTTVQTRNRMIYAMNEFRRERDMTAVVQAALDCQAWTSEIDWLDERAVAERLADGNHLHTPPARAN